MRLYYSCAMKHAAKIEYALQVLKKRLKEIGIEAMEAQTELDAPLLKIECSREEDLDQSFALKWFPKVDVKIHYDPYFTFSPDVAPEFMQMALPEGDVANTGTIVAEGPAGILYGIIEFCERCEVRNTLPLRPLDIRREPRLNLRSASLMLMKAGDYDIDINSKEFPWFYDKSWWTAYLDMLAENRYNALTMWNFHPFPYFVKLPNYPNLNPVDDEQLEKNREQLMWICTEVEKRCMSILFHFYNIYVSHPFANHVGMKSIREFTEVQRLLINDYIQECMKEFVSTFPAVGLMPCLGEGVPGGQAEKFAAEVLIPAVKETGKTPPFIVRQWSSLTTENVKKHIIGKYEHLYVMVKHNAEHIAGEVPDARLREWAKLDVPCMVNFHMFSEIDPFRWVPYGYIRRMCLNYQAMGLNGIHIYSPWPWRVPDTGDKNYDKSEPERDKFYYECWGRYSFDAIRDDDEEMRFWVRRRTAEMGSTQAAEAVVESQNILGPVLPRLQQHLWIHYDNHSVLTGGFKLKQYYEARSMHGRKVIATDILEDILPLTLELRTGIKPTEWDYTIEQCLEQSLKDTNLALNILEKAGVCADLTEAGRYRYDAEAIKLTILYHTIKISAVKSFNRFYLDHHIQDLEQALQKLEESVETYKQLTDLCSLIYTGISDVYPIYPIAISGRENMPYHWFDLQPAYEKELEEIRDIYRMAVEDGIPSSIMRMKEYMREVME